MKINLNPDRRMLRQFAWASLIGFPLITGYLERNEDPKLGVAREVKEELNLDAVETNLIGNYIFERKNEIMLCYHVIAIGEVRLSPELIDYRRYQPHELRPWPRATGFAVADWMKSRGLEVTFRDLPPINVAASPDRKD